MTNLEKLLTIDDNIDVIIDVISEHCCVDLDRYKLSDSKGIEEDGGHVRCSFCRFHHSDTRCQSLIKDWLKEEYSLKLGDEVRIKNVGVTCIVIRKRQTVNEYVVLSPEGVVHSCGEDSLVKTGKSYPELANFLESSEEDKDA